MKKSLMNNLGLKLLAFLFALLLWLIVVNIDNPITDATFDGIPVTVEHPEIITQDQKSYQIIENTDKISVTVYAKRSELEKIKAEDIVATADMKELYLESQVPIQIEIPGFDIDSASANPRNLQVKIESNKSNTFPISVTTTGKVRDGYVLGGVQADPERINVNGPESVIDSISRVVAEVDITGLSHDTTLDASVVYYDSDNSEINPEQIGNNLGTTGVKVHVTLYQTASIPVEVDTSGITAASGYSVADVTWTPEEIQIAGEQSVLEGIEKISIPADAVEAQDISQRTERTIDITSYLPEGTRLVDESGNNVLVTIRVEKDGTKSFDLPVGSITVNNLDENLTLNYGEGEDLEIHVRGPQEVLDGLDISEIKASIDLKDYKKAGEYELGVDIPLPDGCSLESQIKIKITLEEKE